MAAINFPTATSNGQTFTADTGVIYTYIGTPPNGFWSGTFGTTGLATLDGRFVALNDGNSIQTMQTQGLKFNNGTADTILLDGVNGKVGVGITTVDANLHVKGSYPTVHIERDHATNYSRLLLDNTANDGGAIDGIGDGVGGLRFSISDGTAGTISEALRIDSSGNVGIGDSAPNGNYGTNLSVHSTATDGARIKISDGTTGKGNTDGLDIISTGGAAYFINRENSFISFTTNSIEGLRIDSSGRLLVGSSTTADNNAKLQVSSTNFGVAQLFRTGSAGASLHISSTTGTLASPNALSNGDHAGYVSFRAYDGATWRTGANIGAAADGQTWASGDCPGRLVFSTTADGATSPTERMRIDSSGKVGIGTTSPSHGLLTLSQSASSFLNALVIQQGNTGFTSSDGLHIGISTGVDAYMMHKENRAIFFGTADTERMRIDAGGDVAIGMTPAGKSLSIQHGANPTLGFYTGSTLRAELNITTADTSLRSYANSPIFFEVGGSERMRIDSSGNVGIGTTSPGNTLEIKSTTNGDGIRLSNAVGSYYHLVRSNGDGLLFDADAGNTGGSGADIRFNVKASEKMRITNSGRVGIGESSPDQLLHLKSTGFPTLRVEDADNSSYFDIANSDGDIILKADEGNTFANSAIRFMVDSTERMRIDSSGRVLIGTAGDVSGGDADVKLQIASATGPSMQFCRTDSNTAANELLGRFFASTEDGGTSQVCGQITFRADGSHATNNHPTRIELSTCPGQGSSAIERMRISNDGHIFFGATTFPTGGSSNGGSAFVVEGNNRRTLYLATTGHTEGLIRFHNQNGQVGTVVVSGSSTSYNTSSDYRLKENVVDLTSAIPRLKTLPVHRFNFITDSEKTVDGFLAHEAQLVVPEAVTGTHNEVDGDGNPVMQAIDQAKIVPLLTAALQEAIGRIETLETEVAALKGG